MILLLAVKFEIEPFDVSHIKPNTQLSPFVFDESNENIIAYCTTNHYLYIYIYTAVIVVTY